MSTTAERPYGSLLGVCQRIEEVAGQIYQLLAQAHRDDAHAVALWTKTAVEEEQHAQQFRLLQDEFISKVNVDFEAARRTLRFVEYMLFRYRTQTPTVRQALLDAIALEEKLQEFHANHVVESGDDGVRRLFAVLTAADQAHKETLQEALDRLRPS